MAPQLEGTDDHIYEIASTDQGTALMDKVDELVKVTGTVAVDGDVKTIIIKSFEVIEE